VQIYSAATSIPVGVAVTELNALGLIGFTDAREEREYVDWLEDQARYIALIKAAKEYYVSASPALTAILDTHGLGFGHSLFPLSAPLQVGLTAEMLEVCGISTPRESAAVMTWWGKWAAIGVPTYSDDGFEGFWLIKPRLEGLTPTECFRYLQVRPRSGAAHHSIAFEATLGLSAREVFIVSDPVVAMRMNLRQLYDGGITAPFVVARPRLPLARIGALRPIYYPVTAEEQLDVYHTALTTLGAGAVWYHGLTKGPDDTRLDFDPREDILPEHHRGMTSDEGVRYLRARVHDSHDAFGNLLLRLSGSDARAATTSHPVDPAHRNQILSHFSGEDADRLSALLSINDSARVVDVDGKLISETPEGWFAGSKLISNVTFIIEEIDVDPVTKAATAHGTMSFAGETWAFDVDYTRFEKRPADFLKSEVLARSGRGVPVVSSTWVRQLIRIAAAFHAPERGILASHYGWQGRGPDAGLCMPRFSVNHSGVFMTESVVPGPQLAAPVNPSLAEWSAFADLDFCKVAMALLINLWRTRHGLPGYGIALPNAQHIIEKVGAALRHTLDTTVDAKAIKAAYEAPLPVLTAWHHHLFAEFTQDFKVAAHIMVAVPRDVFRLLRLHRGWLCVDAVDIPDENALRLIFVLLAELWDAPIDPNTDGWIHGLGTAVNRCVAERLPGHKVVSEAAKDIDAAAFSHPGNAGSLIISHLLWAVSEGHLEAEDRGDIVVFTTKALRRAFNMRGAPLMELSYIERVLLRSNLLMRAEREEWGIQKVMWDSYASLYAINNS
jgi:hypothetical protein